MRPARRRVGCRSSESIAKTFWRSCRASAKKYRGERLYRLARRGELVERQPVTVRVYTLELLAFALPFVTLKLGCSKGTYARSLCDDIGRVLGCGGHLHALT